MEEIGPELVSETVLKRHGYRTVSDNAPEAVFEEVETGKFHPTVRVVRVWDNITIAPHDEKMISSEIFTTECIWDTSVPDKNEVTTKLDDYLNGSSRAPIN